MYITEAEMKMALGRLPSPNMVTGDRYMVDIDKDRFLIFQKRRATTGPTFCNVYPFEWVLGTLNQCVVLQDLRQFVMSRTSDCKKQETMLNIVTSLIQCLDADGIELVDDWVERRCTTLNATANTKAEAERKEMNVEAINEIKRTAEAYNGAVLDALVTREIETDADALVDGTIIIEVTDK